MKNSQPWIYRDYPLDMIPNEAQAFVYLIERINTEESGPYLYVGKKNFFRYSKGKPVGESDWQSYWGSSNSLNEDIDIKGLNNFKRTILHICETKGEASYLEVKEQFDRDVLRSNIIGEKIYYNGAILGGKHFKSADPMDIGECYEKMTQYRGTTSGKIWMNNGVNKNRVVTPAEAIKWTNKGWREGRIYNKDKKIPYNNGHNNIYLLQEENIPREYSRGELTCRWTNGTNNEIRPIDSEEADGWYKGFSGNKNYIWVNNGIVDLKILTGDKDKFKKNGYLYDGRCKSVIIGKVCVYKGDVLSYIYSSDLDYYISDGWTQGNIYTSYSRVNVTDGINNRHFKDEESAADFLENNNTWYMGQSKRENFNTLGIVPVIDLMTREAICISSDDYDKYKWIKYIARGVYNEKNMELMNLFDNNNNIMFSGYRGEMNSKFTFTKRKKEKEKVLKSSPFKGWYYMKREINE